MIRQVARGKVIKRGDGDSRDVTKGRFGGVMGVAGASRAGIGSDSVRQDIRPSCLTAVTAFTMVSWERINLVQLKPTYHQCFFVELSPDAPFSFHSRQMRMPDIAAPGPTIIVAIIFHRATEVTCRILLANQSDPIKPVAIVNV